MGVSHLLSGGTKMAHEKPDKKVYSFRLEENLVKELKRYAARENRSFSNFIETILKEYLAEREIREKD